jgi:hypothetical protein
MHLVLSEHGTKDQARQNPSAPPDMAEVFQEIRDAKHGVYSFSSARAPAFCSN